MKKYKPFWTEELVNIKTIRDNARRQAELTGSVVDNIALRQAQAVLKKAIKPSKRDCFKEFAANIDFRRDGTRAHRFLSTLKNEPISNKNEVLISNGRTFTTNRDKALALAKHYASVCRLPKNNLKPSNLPRTVAGCLNREEDQLFNKNFSMNELLRAMKETKMGKSAGTDDLPAEFFLNLGEKARLTLLAFFNIIWNTHVPSEWKKAIIIPILKPHKPPECPSSYRPISLTNACCKLMERMVTNRLNYFLEHCKKISDYQAGFRRKRSTIEQAAFFSQCIKDGFHGKKSTLAVYVDFKSAYDTIWLKNSFKK